MSLVSAHTNIIGYKQYIKLNIPTEKLLFIPIRNWTLTIIVNDNVEKTVKYLYTWRLLFNLVFVKKNLMSASYLSTLTD